MIFVCKLFARFDVARTRALIFLFFSTIINLLVSKNTGFFFLDCKYFIFGLYMYRNEGPDLSHLLGTSEEGSVCCYMAKTFEQQLLS
jgi:hypothetical protein